MIIKNAQVFTENNSFEKIDLAFDNGVFTEIQSEITGRDSIDLEGCKIIPGLIDVHSHGAAGADGCDGTEESLKKLSNYYADNGITSFLATTMTLSKQQLIEIMSTINSFISQNQTGAYAHGINMEGPFFNREKKGAQNGEFLHLPDIEFFIELWEASGHNIKLVSVAPELNGAIPFINQAKDLTHVSIAHTAANFDQAQAAVQAGVTHITHLYNAMMPYSHRDPGVIGAAYDSKVFCELISDGIHVHPAVIRNTFRQVGTERVVLISDSMRACGMENGIYDLGGQAVTVNGNLATLPGDVIAGSVTNLFSCMKKAIEFGVPTESAILAATRNPAKSIGVYDSCGSIATGKQADFVVLDHDLNIKQVYIKGVKHR